MAYISKQFVRYRLTSVHHEQWEQATMLQAIETVRSTGELRRRVPEQAFGITALGILVNFPIARKTDR